MNIGHLMYEEDEFEEWIVWFNFPTSDFGREDKFWKEIGIFHAMSIYEDYMWSLPSDL